MIDLIIKSTTLNFKHLNVELRNGVSHSNTIQQFLLPIRVFEQCIFWQQCHLRI